MDFLDSSGVAEAAKYVLDAVHANNWGAALAALVVFVTVLATRSGFSKKIPFFTTERGGAVLVVAIAGALGVLNALMAGESMTWQLLGKTLIISALAAGGRSIAKKLLFGESIKRLVKLVTPDEAAKEVNKL